MRAQQTRSTLKKLVDIDQENPVFPKAPKYAIKNAIRKWGAYEKAANDWSYSKRNCD